MFGTKRVWANDKTFMFGWTIKNNCHVFKVQTKIKLLIVYKHINYKCNFFTKIIMDCRWINSPQACILEFCSIRQHVVFYKMIERRMRMKRDIKHSKSSIRGILQRNESMVVQITFVWAALVRTNQQPLELSWEVVQNLRKMHEQKKINFIIATSAAEEIGLDVAIASVVAKSQVRTAFKEQKITALEGLMKDSHCHDPCPRRHLCKNLLSIKS